VKQTVFSMLLLLTSSTLVFADACTELASQAETALKMEGLDPAMREQLEQLREVGRSGDIEQCTAANTGSVNQSTSPGMGGPGHSCNKRTPDTV
jgi:hypothetical protein